MKYKKYFLTLLFLIIAFLIAEKAFAAPVPQGITFPTINIGGEAAKGPNAVAMPLQILFLITILTIAPYIVIMTTAFIRITIVLAFVRSALGTQQAPPTQVLMGLALFLTLYVMMPVGQKINTEALQPLLSNKINQVQAYEKAMVPLRGFMMNQMREKDLRVFIGLANLKEKPKSINDVPMYIVIPAFITSEITTAFAIGFLIFLPFLVIDMIIASVLMSMGMFMLSPMAISLPFKLLMFVMIDGWEMLVQSLVKSFKM